MKFTLKPTSWWAVLYHFLIIIVLSILGLLYFFKVWLPDTTNFGEEIEVPDLENVSFEEAKKILDEKKLRYEIDEINYSPGHKKNAVIKHQPRPGAKVKENRRIYLTINDDDIPKVTITKSNLEAISDGDFSDAKINLQKMKLNIGKRIDTSGYHNYVYNVKADGKAIKPGDQFPIHTSIDFVVGNGRVKDGTLPEEEEEDTLILDLDSESDIN